MMTLECHRTSTMEDLSMHVTAMNLHIIAWKTDASKGKLWILYDILVQCRLEFEFMILFRVFSLHYNCFFVISWQVNGSSCGRGIGFIVLKPWNETRRFTQVSCSIWYLIILCNIPDKRYLFIMVYLSIIYYSLLWPQTRVLVIFVHRKSNNYRIHIPSCIQLGYRA